ncbi:MAG: hypothetical protein EOP45_15725 [Sphingobacteriaceae bacterium]|nr:MAG: hypothetical protein EOP45_15725 [Sphingobacteriaceae bacterium]
MIAFDVSRDAQTRPESTVVTVSQRSPSFVSKTTESEKFVTVVPSSVARTPLIGDTQHASDFAKRSQQSGDQQNSNSLVAVLRSGAPDAYVISSECRLRSCKVVFSNSPLNSTQEINNTVLSEVDVDKLFLSVGAKPVDTDIDANGGGTIIFTKYVSFEK